MSDQSKHRNEEPLDREEPGKRLENKQKPPLTPEQAKKRKERIIMAVMIALAAVMAVAAAAAMLYSRWVKKPTLPPSPGPAQSSAPAQPSDEPVEDPSAEPTLSFDAVQPKVGGERKSQDIYTILIFGSDETSGLTDTMMVATYDVTNQKATVMSLPRDTLINSRAWGIASKKLNAVYNIYGQGDRGVEALKNEVSELVGFVPDYYVQIDWALVGEMVDAIGGVWFDNPYHMEYYDPFQDLNIYQEQGYRFITGDDAMQIVRWRKNNPGVSSKGGTGSDTDRLRVQHTFLKAVLKQTLQIGNITRVGQLIDLFNSRVNSDLAVENMFWFAKEAVLGGLQVDDVEFCTMPYGFANYGGDGGDYVYPIQSQLLAVINESLNPYKEQVTIRQLDLMSPTAEGGVRSSTGRLADPSLAYPPVVETEDPEESDPVESGEPSESDPVESGEPSESGPVESGEPSESGPVESDPIPAQTDAPPPESQPAGPDVPAGPVGEPDPAPSAGEPEPAPSADEPGAAPTAENGDVTDWGETPD